MRTKLLLLSMCITSFGSSVYAQKWTSGQDILHVVRGGNIASYSDKTDGYLYIVSGRDEQRIVQTTQRYTVSTNSWDTLSPHPTGLLGAATTCLNGNVYIIGGVINPPGFGQDTVYKLDIQQNKWSTVAPFPYEIVDAKAATYQDSLIYVAGGLGGPYDSANVFVYNATNNTWRKATTIPSPTGLNFGGFTVTGDQLLYMCGTDGFGSGNFYNTVYVGTIDQSNRSIIHWTKGADFPGNTRSFFDAQPWISNTAIMTGGSTDNTFSTWSDECYVFDPGKNSWQKQPDKPTPWLTGQSGSVTLPGNKWLLVCAGGFDSTYIHQTELYDPGDLPSGIEEKENSLPFSLLQNTPNPFNNQTTIQYTIHSNTEHITITIHDTEGRLIATLLDEKQKTGSYSLNYTSHLTAGVYYYKVTAGRYTQVKKMIYVN